MLQAQISTQLPRASEKAPLMFTPFVLDKARNKLVLDLSNSLPTKVNTDINQVTDQVDQSLFDNTLSLGFYQNGELSDFTLIKKLSDLDDTLLTQYGGLLEVDLDDDTTQLLQTTPCAINSSDESSNFLWEQKDGYYMRADKFVFRMNPDNSDPDRGATANADVYVYQFGEDASNVTINAAPLTLEQAAQQFTPPPKPSVPQSAFSVAAANGGSTGNSNVATINLSATDPGNPRGFIDGQVYGAFYCIEGIGSDYSAAINEDMLSVQVYQQQSYTDAPTWTKDVGPVLSQYGWLYPVMGRFDLGNYDSVKKYAGAIQSVLEAVFSNPNYMPVTRDLSASRLAMILKWFDNDMPQ